LAKLRLRILFRLRDSKGLRKEMTGIIFPNSAWRKGITGSLGMMSVIKGTHVASPRTAQKKGKDVVSGAVYLPP